MKRLTLFLILLLLTCPALGQSWVYLDLEGNGGDSQQIDSAAVVINPGGDARHAQTMAPTISELNFGGSEVLQAINDTDCTDGDETDTDCWSAAIDGRGANQLYIFAEGESAASTVTIQVYLQGAHASDIYIPSGGATLNTTQAHGATAPTKGTGLACTTACWTTPAPVTVGTMGAENIKIYVSASGGATEEVNIWAATAAGQDGS